MEGIVNQVYPVEIQINKDNTTDTETPFLDLHLSIADDFDSANFFECLDDDVSRRASSSYGVYLSQLIRLLESANMSLT